MAIALAPGTNGNDPSVLGAAAAGGAQSKREEGRHTGEHDCRDGPAVAVESCNTLQGLDREAFRAPSATGRGTLSDRHS